MIAHYPNATKQRKFEIKLTHGAIWLLISRYTTIQTFSRVTATSYMLTVQTAVQATIRPVRSKSTFYKKNPKQQSLNQTKIKTILEKTHQNQTNKIITPPPPQFSWFKIFKMNIFYITQYTDWVFNVIHV